MVAGHNTIRIFDNEVNPKPVLPGSRVIWVKLDPSAKTATLIRSLDYPDHLSALSQGSAQTLDNRNTFVGWGEPGRFPEFDSNGRMIFDATLRRATTRTQPTVSVGRLIEDDAFPGRCLVPLPPGRALRLSDTTKVSANAGQPIQRE